MLEMSVVMATYNEDPRFLKLCIDSILNQTFKNFEFLIVTEPGEKNAMCLDNVAEADSRVRILKNDTRSGVAGSRNRAIMESSGTYIAIVDGDDYYDVRRFERQVRFLRDNPHISVVGSNIFLVDENDSVIGERLYPEDHERIKKSFLFKMAVANPSIIVRKNDVAEVGFFAESLVKAEDFDLWLRFLAKKKKMHNLQEKLVYYRTQSNDNKKRGRVHYNNYYRTLKTHSKFIWPLNKRFASLIFFFAISYIPDFLLNYLLNLRIVRRIKNIRITG